MDIKLSDTKGRFFQLTLTPQISNKPEPGIAAVNTQKKAIAFLDNVKVCSPVNNWSNARKQLYPRDKAPLDDSWIKENIANDLVNKKLYIMLHKTSVSSGNPANRGATGNKQPSNPGGNRADVSAAAVSPAAVEEKPGDANAMKSATPSTVNKSKESTADSNSPSGATNDEGKSSTGVSSDKKCVKEGCPISMVSGEELLPIEDFQLPGPMPFVWKRYYRTGHSQDSGLGHGWTHSGGEKLYLHDHSVEITDEEGRSLTFARPRLHQRSKLVNEEMDLDFVSENSFVLKQEGQWDKVFTRPGEGSYFRLTQLRHQAYRPAKSKAFTNYKRYKRGQSPLNAPATRVR